MQIALEAEDNKDDNDYEYSNSAEEGKMNNSGPFRFVCNL